MWPFDKPNEPLPFTRVVPKLGPSPAADPKDLKLNELEMRCLGLEQVIMEICSIIKLHQDACNYNFKNIEGSFSKLVEYIIRPSTNIMDGNKDKN